MIDRLNSPRRSASPTRHLPKSRTTIFLFLLISFVILLYLSFSPFKHKSLQSSQDSKFGIVIDAGSSGTRIHVFAFKEGSASVPLIDLDRTAVMRLSPGLSSFVNEPQKAGESIEKLVNFAKKNLREDLIGSTEIRLMATAGLRMVNEGIREVILESCRRILRESGFKFENDWASVIPGYNEGVYAWVAANYALGTLGGDPNKTIGIIELGGASAQVTFISDENIPDGFLHKLEFGGIVYKLYSYSFLHFGQNAAQESLHELTKSNGDPCMPKGYTYEKEIIHGESTGNFTQCKIASFSLLKNGTGSIFVPELKGNFLATENFFYTSKFFGLERKFPLSEISLAGEKFCKEDWLTLKKKYNNINNEELSKYCFSSAYIVSLIHDFLGVPMDDKRIEFSNNIGDFRVEWALGAFITHKMNIAQNSNDFAIKFRHILAPLFLILVLVVFVSLSVSRFRKPQIKTVYDLEKGRYIVTRIER